MDKFTREIMDAIKKDFTDSAGEKEYQNVSEAKEYYVKDLNDNFYRPMNDTVKNAYCSGSGNEIASGKMNSIRSSSAMTYNLLWDGTANIIKPYDRIISAGKYFVEFEKKYHTLKPSISGNPANLDAFLYNSELCEAIACEMKMTEWLFNKPGTLKSKYLDKNSYINSDAGEVFVSVAESLIANSDYDEDILKSQNEYAPFTSRYDSFQMFKHTVACYTACVEEEKRKIKKLTLLNCVWDGLDDSVVSDKSRDRYNLANRTEQAEFGQFRDCMEPVKKLFAEIGVEFNVVYYSVDDFIAIMEKTDDELKYLNRYTYYDSITKNPKR